ncbi:hypothetical protein ENHYDAX1_220144 [Enhydrobacter sp. AX1]|nr:hypothetical protein ENHYDAX1_220144 [Enhydrobacter sp. AX1]
MCVVIELLIKIIKKGDKVDASVTLNVSQIVDKFVTLTAVSQSSAVGNPAQSVIGLADSV